MGYYTNYKLTANKPTSAIAELRALSASAEIALCGDGESSDSAKWYDHEEDLKGLSIRHPEILFTLEGKGEEAGDLWFKFFRDGKMQVSKAHIVFDPFDPEKLK